MRKLESQIQYWAHMLDESFGDQRDIPQYTGKLDGYKWVYYMKTNIEESAFLKTFDSEAEAVQAGVDDLMVEAGSWDNNFCEPGKYDGFFNSIDEAVAYFKKTKQIECTDQNSFQHLICVKRIKASDMPKLLEIVYSNDADFDDPIEFDGNNMSVVGMFGFNEWDQIEALTA